MKKLFSVFAFFLLVLSASASPAFTSLVDDSGAFYVSIGNFPELRKHLAAGPFLKTWNDPKVQKYFAPWIESIKWEEADEAFFKKTGLHLNDFADRFTGQVLLTVKFNDKPMEGNEPPVDALVLAELKAELSEITQLVKSMHEKDEKAKEGEESEGADFLSEKQSKDIEETETVAGTVVHSYVRVTTVEGETKREVLTVWAYSKGVLALSSSVAEVSAFLVAQQAGSTPNAFSNSEVYLNFEKSAPGVEVMAFVNFQGLIPKLKQAALKSAAGKPANPFVNIEDIFRTSGLEALNSGWFGFRSEETRDVFLSGLNYAEQKGLLKMIALRDGPPTKAEFASERWLSVSAAHFSLPDAYDALESTLRDYNPAVAAIASAGLAGYNKKLGFDIRRDLVGSIGDEVLVGTATRPGTDVESAGGGDLDVFYAIALTNPKAFSSALDLYEKMIDPANRGIIAKRAFMEEQLHSVVLGQDERQRPFILCYAVVSNQLFLSFGSPGPVEGAIRTWKNHEKTIWERADLKPALAEIPGDAVAFTVQDTKSLLTLILSKFADAQASGNRRENGDAPPQLESADKPTAADLAKYWGPIYGWTWRDSHGIYSKSILNHQP